MASGAEEKNSNHHQKETIPDRTEGPRRPTEVREPERCEETCLIFSSGPDLVAYMKGFYLDYLTNWYGCFLDPKGDVLCQRPYPFPELPGHHFMLQTPFIL